MDYASYLKGKDVALVGPSDGYTGSGKGPEINSFDVVVRLNWGCPVPHERREDLGSRTDVLYKRMLTNGQPSGDEVEGWIADGVRWVVTSDRNVRTPSYRRLAMLVKNRFPVEPMGDVRAEIVRAIANGPLIGVMAIKHLLRYQLRSLTVMNCDFYQGGYHAGYGGQHYRQSLGRKEGVIGEKHDADLQLAYLQKIRYADPRLCFDARLDEMAKAASRAQSANDVVAIIPARYESGRFPGKPLAPIHGKPMILHVCERVAQAVENVIVATDDERIARCVRSNGYQVAMTGPALTGTDRVAEAARGQKASIIVNIQGDEPLVDPEDVRALIDAKRGHPQAVINGMCRLNGDPDDRTVVKAAVSAKGRLLYASRAPIPATKDGHAAGWKQLGMYAFSRQELEAFAKPEERGIVERAEDVEILRFLELGIPVQMIEVQGTAQAVDLPEHVAVVEGLIAREAVAA